MSPGTPPRDASPEASPARGGALEPPRAADGLSEARAARLLDERAARLALRRDRATETGAATAPGLPSALPPMLACAIGRECYGLPLDRLLAVQPATALAGLPVMSPPLLGFFARAGQPYAVLDLAAMLGLPAPSAPSFSATGPGGAEGPPGHLVLLRGAPGGATRRVALRVDRALGVVTPRPLSTPSDTAPSTTPATRAGIQGGIQGGGAIAGRGLVPPGPLGPGETVLGLLDPDRLLQPYLSATPAAGA